MEACSRLGGRLVITMFNNRAFITEAETNALISYVQIAAADVVEVGTYLGGTAENIAPFLPTDCALWTVDLCAGFVDHLNPALVYHDYLAQFERVFYVIGDSAQVGQHWGRDIGFLFIDGNHQHGFVSDDFDVWTQWLVPQGVVALHDAAGWADGARPWHMTLNNERLIHEPGPMAVVDRVVSSGDWRQVQVVDSVVFLTRA